MQIRTDRITTIVFIINEWCENLVSMCGDIQVGIFCNGQLQFRRSLSHQCSGIRANRILLSFKPFIIESVRMNLNFTLFRWQYKIILYLNTYHSFMHWDVHFELIAELKNMMLLIIRSLLLYIPYTVVEIWKMPIYYTR